MGVGQLGGSLDLPEEPLRSHGLGQIRVENLDGHLPVVFEVIGQIHSGHAPATDLSFDPVAIGQCRRETFCVIH